jgi:two-component system nitrogen regulation sensor histidine kinase NtrY
VLSAIWTGIAVADRLVRPIRQLIGAADEVATGNLDVSVPVRVPMATWPRSATRSTRCFSS